MDGKYIERGYLLTRLDRAIETEKDTIRKHALIDFKEVAESIPVTYDCIEITKKIYANADARMPGTGEKLIKVEKAVDIVNGVFKK